MGLCHQLSAIYHRNQSREVPGADSYQPKSAWHTEYYVRIYSITTTSSPPDETTLVFGCTITSVRDFHLSRGRRVPPAAYNPTTGADSYSVKVSLR